MAIETIPFEVERYLNTAEDREIWLEEAIKEYEKTGDMPELRRMLEIARKARMKALVGDCGNDGA